jgi:ferredoxin-NADP reductase
VEELDLNLTVEQMHTVADGVRQLTFMRADGTDLPDWEAGAHVDLHLPGGLVRHYSLCGSRSDRKRWTIAVLREVKSRGGSVWMHTQVQVGDLIRIRGPRNYFPLVAAHEYVFIAGGIGITPILPMINAVSQTAASWKLLYGGRTRASMAFGEELESLGGKAALCPEATHGLLDVKSAIGSPRPGCVVYCCGPEPLIEAVARQCADWPDDALHVERFQSPVNLAETQNLDFEVVLATSGKSVSVARNQSILDALDSVGVHVPRSCSEGICGTCLVGVIEGIPDHRDSFLMGKKRAKNDSMTLCCSRAKTSRLVLNL